MDIQQKEDRVCGAGPAVEIDSDFPGGNAVVEAIDGDTVRLRPDLRDTEGSWFYWCFRVRGAQGRTLRFDFTADDPVGVRGAAISTDEGATWRWGGAERATVSSFIHTFLPGDRSVRLSFGMTYTQENWDRFLAGLPRGASVRSDVLCQSRQGRPVERLHVGRLDGGARHRVLLMARHHACEMMADYAFEGVVQAVLAGEGRDMEWALVPFVDKDGVEAGDQGKNRRPHDHNRDYVEPGIYPETRALRAFAPAWSEGRLAVVLDLHCPWIRSGHNERIFQVGAPDSGPWAEQQRLGRLLEDCRTGPLPYRAEDDLPFGKDWNVGSGLMYRNCSRWGQSVEGVRLSTSFELPYANARGVIVDAASARSFGRDLARAIRLYLD